MRKRRAALLLTAVMMISCSAWAIASEAGTGEISSESAPMTEAAAAAETAVPETETAESAGADTASETPAAEEAAAEAPAPADPQAFLADIGAAYNDRLALSGTYTESDLSRMTNDEIAEANNMCAESERWFYDRYKDAVFDNKSIQYLCEQYVKGLGNQYEAYENWKANHDIDSYNELWEAGYNKRAYVVVELADYYDIGFKDIEAMRKKVEELNNLDPKFKGNEGVDSETVRQVQTWLNALGFQIGEVTGNAGPRTYTLVRRFQTMFGFPPADGVIDEELIAQLKAEAEKAAPPETEAQTEGNAEAEDKERKG